MLWINFMYFAFTITFMHLADAFIQSNLQWIQVIHLLHFMQCWIINNVENRWDFFPDSSMNKKLNKNSIYLKI